MLRKKLRDTIIGFSGIVTMKVERLYGSIEEKRLQLVKEAIREAV